MVDAFETGGSPNPQLGQDLRDALKKSAPFTGSAQKEKP